MVFGLDLGAFPEEGAQVVSLVLVGKAFAMEPAFPVVNVNSQGGLNRAVFILNNLEFHEPLFEVFPRQSVQFPKLDKLGQIVNIGAAYLPAGFPLRFPGMILGRFVCHNLDQDYRVVLDLFRSP